MKCCVCVADVASLTPPVIIQCILYSFSPQICITHPLQLPMVAERLMSKRTTAGQLCNALLDYANKPAKKRTTKDLFTVLMETM